MNNFFYTKCFILLIFGTFSCGNFDCNDQQYENLKASENNSQNNQNTSNKGITNNETKTNDDINAPVNSIVNNSIVNNSIVNSSIVNSSIENSDSQPYNNPKDNNVFQIMNNLQKHNAKLKEKNNELHNIGYSSYYLRSRSGNMCSCQENYVVNNFWFQRRNETSYYCGDRDSGIGQRKIGQVYYTGQVNDFGEMNGFGVINNTQDGTLYVGQVIKTTPYGLGFLITSDGSWQFGQFCTYPDNKISSGLQYDSKESDVYNVVCNDNSTYKFPRYKGISTSQDDIQNSTFIKTKSNLLVGIDRNNDLWISVDNIKMKLNIDGTNIKSIYCYDGRYKKNDSYDKVINGNKYKVIKDNYAKFIKIDFNDTSLIEFSNPNLIGFENNILTDFDNTNFIKYQKILQANYNAQASLFSIKKISYDGDLRAEYGLITYNENNFTPWYKLSSWEWKDFEKIEKYACRKIGFDRSQNPYFRTDILHNDSTISTLEIHDEDISFKKNNNRISITYDESSKIKAIKDNNVNNHFIPYLEKINNDILSKVLLGDIFGEKIHLKYEWKLDDIFNNNPEIQNKIRLTNDKIDRLRQTIIEKIQQLGNHDLFIFDSKVSGIKQYVLGKIGERPYKLFIKKEGNTFFIHNSIGSFE